MRILLLCLSLSFSSLLSAQFGATAFANFQSNDWDIPQGENIPSTLKDIGGELAVHYWFRLPKKRVEFQPTLYFGSTQGDGFDGSLKELGFQFKTNIYLFDFGTDCNCPTFGKQGPSLQKGFFIQLSPGYALYNFNAATADIENTSGFTFGGGAGIDFGLSNLLTITPIASFRYATQPYFENDVLDVNGQVIGVGGPKLFTYQLGLQATFRIDKRRY